MYNTRVVICPSFPGWSWFSNQDRGVLKVPFGSYDYPGLLFLNLIFFFEKFKIQNKKLTRNLYVIIICNCILVVWVKKKIKT